MYGLYCPFCHEHIQSPTLQFRVSLKTNKCPRSHCTWIAFELELKLCRSISGSHPQEHPAMGKNCVIMEESICVGQAMLMEMKTGDLENDA